MKNFGSWLSGFITGAAVASVVTLLNAPQSGDETRDLLRRKSMEYRDLAEDKIEEGQRTVSKTLAKAGEKVAETMEQGSEKLKETTEKVAQRVEEGSEKMKEKADDVRKARHEAERAASPDKPPTTTSS